jgi:hypothetical protein
MDCQVTQDQHMAAIDWLEENVSGLLQEDIDTTIAMVEQVVYDQQMS